MSMLWIGVGVAVLGTAVSYKQNKDNANEANKTGQINAQIGEYQAQDVLDRSNIEVNQTRRRIAKMMGIGRNEIGARNVELSGSALSLLEDSAQIGQEDINTVRNDAARQAWGYRNQASEASRIGKVQQGNYNAAATGSLLTGASQAYGIWRSR